jgi:hypothetical protein
MFTYMQICQMYYERMITLRSAVWYFDQLGYTRQERRRIVTGIWYCWGLPQGGI